MVVAARDLLHLHLFERRDVLCPSGRYPHGAQSRMPSVLCQIWCVVRWDWPWTSPSPRLGVRAAKPGRLMSKTQCLLHSVFRDLDRLEMEICPSFCAISLSFAALHTWRTDVVIVPQPKLP